MENTASSSDTMSGRYSNANFNSITSYAAARTTLSLSINLYNNDTSQEREEEDDDRKPAARQDMQESVPTNGQVITIDDSSKEGEEEVDDDRKPAARQDMQESGLTNGQAIPIDDSSQEGEEEEDDDRKPAARQDIQEFGKAINFDEVDETPESPPHQRPRYSNHSTRARSRGQTRHQEQVIQREQVVKRLLI
ncbi:predicted protein [Chaetoceros tenuissimus]|uniref:Uncharacterized protein n=1 Tax=Chaetoceros tenuissimus TaxID=426638 RepID=A0AAD3HBA2_9STRA|nr:predicted protein [Chaetoceros tenuissimus]